MYVFNPSATPDMASYEPFKETWLFEETSSTGIKPSGGSGRTGGQMTSIGKKVYYVGGFVR